MNSSKLTKAFSLLAIVFCIAITLIAIINITMPLDVVFITPPYNDDKFFLYQTLTAIILLLAFTPQPIALAAFYFSGSIGKNWFAHILFGLLTVSFAVQLLVFISFIFVYLTGSAQDRVINSVLFRYVSAIVGVFGFLHFNLFPLAFLVTSLVVQKISLWKRFLPLISYILTMIIAVVLGGIIYGIGVTTRIQSIYQGTQRATVINWVMLGMAAWALTALPAFFKDKTEIKS